MPESLVVLRHCEDVLLELTSCCGLRSAQQRVSSKATFTLSIRPSQGSVKAGAWIFSSIGRKCRPEESGLLSQLLMLSTPGQLWGFIIVTLFAPTWYFTANGHQRADAGSPAHAEHSFARQLTLGGVPQFFEVTPKLYRGGQPTTEGFDSLAGMGKLGMEYVPMPWHCPFPKDKIFARFLTLLRQNRQKKVFVHCRLGDDRVGIMIAAFRMAEQGWTADEAKQEMRAFGFKPLHHLICLGLSRYETNFPRKYKTSPAFQNLRATEESPNSPQR